MLSLCIAQDPVTVAAGRIFAEMVLAVDVNGDAAVRREVGAGDREEARLGEELEGAEHGEEKEGN